MNSKEIITLMQLTQGATIIGGHYLEDANNPAIYPKEYHFKEAQALGLDVGDLAVVQTRNSFRIIRVSSVRVPSHAIGCDMAALKHVVQKVDTSALDRISEAEQKAAHELAMSEVHERLTAFREQLGTGFDRVSSLLAAPVDQREKEKNPPIYTEEDFANEKGSSL